MRWIKKWMSPFRMGTTNSITMQSFGKTGQCASAVGAKMWCLFFVSFFFIGRMPRSGKLPVLNLLTGQKSGFSPAGATYFERFEIGSWLL